MQSRLDLKLCAIFDTIAIHDRPVQKAHGPLLFDRRGPQPGSGMVARTFQNRPSRLIGKDIQKVEFGWPIGMPYCRTLGRGMWEVRSDLSGGRIARVIFAIVGGEMILLHGFEKKSQKTPSSDLDLALKRKREIDK
jgi:phage-related protein